MPKATTKTIPPDSATSESGAPEETSGAERVAERLKGGAESGPAPSSSAERVRRHRENKKKEKAAAEAGEVSAAEQREAGALFNAVWNFMVVPMAGGRLAPMNEDQTERAGVAFAPVVRKYAPMLGEWRVEFMAVLCVGVIARECYIPEAQVSEAEPEA